MIGYDDIGKMVRVSNGEPRPPERFNRKLKTWKSKNYEGKLVEAYEAEYMKTAHLTGLRAKIYRGNFGGIMEVYADVPAEAVEVIEEAA